jgi:hypothetical protein
MMPHLLQASERCVVLRLHLQALCMASDPHVPSRKTMLSRHRSICIQLHYCGNTILLNQLEVPSRLVGCGEGPAAHALHCGMANLDEEGASLTLGSTLGRQLVVPLLRQCALLRMTSIDL